MVSRIVDRAFTWIRRERGDGFLTDQEYCPTRDVFQARLNRLSVELERDGGLAAAYPLVVAVAGEIGNNAFDHNLGNWRDVPGVYFVCDIADRQVIIADRGQGILATLRRIRPDLHDDIQALHIAFTEHVSGRSPEQRGNGLKFVASVVKRQQWNFVLYSGGGVARIQGTDLQEETNENVVCGVLAILRF